MTSPFYSSEQTDLSRAVLAEVLGAVPGAILIGGWATWVRTGGPMSHDIDLIVAHAELAALGAVVGDMSQSRHLAGVKWRATWRAIHLDLYVPYQSRLGANLQLRTEDLAGYAEEVNGYRVLSVAAHTATKIAALLDRPDSLPGRKDRQEILRLLDEPATEQTPLVVAAASARAPAQVSQLIGNLFAFLVGEPSLTRQGRARLRHTGAAWAGSLAAATGRPGGTSR